MKRSDLKGQYPETERSSRATATPPLPDARYFMHCSLNVNISLIMNINNYRKVVHNSSRRVRRVWLILTS
jgi:hypothetical protein